MKSRPALRALAVLLALASFSINPLHATEAASAGAPAAPSPRVAEVEKLVGLVMQKVKAGADEEALAPEFAGLDRVIASAGPEEAAEISLLKARIYLEVLENPAQAVKVLKAIRADYPSSGIAAQVGPAIENIEARLAAESALAVGSVFPALGEPDLDGKPIELSAYAGKIVLVDFWATWCGPCVAELPNVKAAYAKYHDKGLEIIGISLDENRDRLTGFLKEHDLPWRQYFDGQGWKNKVSTRFGIDSIPATFLLDGQGRIIAKNLRGPALEQKLAKLLGN